MVRKKHRKYNSKYYRKYGYSIKDASTILGWSYGTVHAYFQDAVKRREMLGLLKVESACN